MQASVIDTPYCTFDRALAATAGHYGRAAALLGVSAKTMTNLVAKACPGTVAKRGRRRRKPLPR